MKYPIGHKKSVKNQLCLQAAQQLRAKGIEKVSVKSVMGAEGMTVGGFYSHFKSKDDLICHAIETSFNEINTEFYDSIDELDDESWLKTATSRYLSLIHRDTVESGCPISCLTTEIPRASKAIQTTFEKSLKDLFRRYEVRLKSKGHQNAAATAIALLSLMAGGIQLSLCTTKQALSKEIVESCLVAPKLLTSNS